MDRMGVWRGDDIVVKGQGKGGGRRKNLRYESGGGGDGVRHGDQSVCKSIREVVARSSRQGMPLCSGIHEKFQHILTTQWRQRLM